MVDMRSKLSSIEQILNNAGSDQLVKLQLKIADVQYTANQNIVLAYSRFNNKELEVQGILQDILIVDNRICIKIGCMIYGYTDAYILCTTDMSDDNIEQIQKLIKGSVITISGIGKVENNQVYLDNAVVQDIAEKKKERHKI